MSTTKSKKKYLVLTPSDIESTEEINKDLETSGIRFKEIDGVFLIHCTGYDKLGIVERSTIEEKIQERFNCEVSIEQRKAIKGLDSMKASSLKMLMTGEVNPKFNPGELGFIMNPDAILKERIFTFHKINENKAAFGLQMLRWCDIKAKGVTVGRTQQPDPVLITSDGEFIPYTPGFCEEHGIKYDVIPEHLPRRWREDLLNTFIQGKAGQIKIKEVFNMIEAQYNKFISMSEIWAKVHALWDIGTYMFPLFKYYPIFELRGHKGTAKTKSMVVSHNITFNATGIMTDPSKAVIFRETNDLRPTKYIDEAENLFKQVGKRVEVDERVEIINSSYQHNGMVARMEIFGKKYKPVYFKTFSPTMVASINGLRGATEDRAIIRVCTKPTKDDGVKSDWEPDPEAKVWEELRHQLYVWTLQNWKAVEKAYNELENLTDLKDREYALWKPLLVIAAMIDQELHDEILLHAERQQEIKAAELIPEDSNEYKILTIAWEHIRQTGKVYIKTIHDSLPKGDYKPGHKTITKRLKDMGLRDYWKRESNGTCFIINKDHFERIIYPLAPDIFSSFSSFSSLEEEEIDSKEEIALVKNNEESRKSMKKTKNKNEENEADVENEGKIDLPKSEIDGFNVHLPCQKTSILGQCRDTPTRYHPFRKQYLCIKHWPKEL